MDSTKKVRRVSLETAPFAKERAHGNWNSRGRWPAQWITLEDEPKAPFVAAYQLTFDIATAEKVLVHVAGDERYELFLDGVRVGQGSERGDKDHWFFESYELDLSAGKHVLFARVWTLAELSPMAQLSLRHGFLLCPDDEKWNALLATGKAPWMAALHTGYEFKNPQSAWGTGSRIIIHGDKFPWGIEHGIAVKWQSAKKGEQALTLEGKCDQPPHHFLLPAMLPEMRHETWDPAQVKVRSVSEVGEGPTAPLPIKETFAENNAETADWQKLVHGQKLTIEAHKRVRVLFDLGNYLCAYHQVKTTGGKGASVRIHWEEALYRTYKDRVKGNRNEVDGKFFCTLWNWEDGVGDTFLTDGGLERFFTSLWWHAGRYVEVVVETRDQAITIESLSFCETRYPQENQGKFEASDSRMAAIIPIAYRALQMCSHETYMDCPFYEQLQYVGDTRLQILATYATNVDDRLPRKALHSFDFSRQIDGVTQSRYPNRVAQVIPPFSLWWLCMIHDFALWRGEKAVVRELMPGARGVLDWFAQFVNADGLVQAPMGWNFTDWVPGWSNGMPSGADTDVSCLVNLQHLLSLQAMYDLETWQGEPERAARYKRLMRESLVAITEKFWDSPRGILADDLEHKSFSEHAQCLAIISGVFDKDKESQMAEGLVTQKGLHQTTIYFTHYLFEAYRLIHRNDLLLKRLEMWFDHIKNGLKTTIEHPEPTRSDCHAWGAHPLYHYQSSILGIRPVALGGKKWRIEPQLGGLKRASGLLPLPQGNLSVTVDLDATPMVTTEIPVGIEAVLVWNGNETVLPAGKSIKRELL